MSADPLEVHVGGSGDLNVYAYVSGQTLKATDPVGLCEDLDACIAGDFRTSAIPEVRALGDTRATAGQPPGRAQPAAPPVGNGYQSLVAREQAAQGNTKMAQVAEAGFGCSYCHLQFTLGRAPTDDELDLHRFSAIQQTLNSGTAFMGTVSGMTGALSPGLAETPQGVTPRRFQQAGEMLRAGPAGAMSEDIAVHGSRATGTARPSSDIDIAIRVPTDQFDSILAARFKSPNPGSAQERTWIHAGLSGKIQRGEAGMRSVGKQLQQDFGIKKVDISVIRKGGLFDQGPYMPFPRPGDGTTPAPLLVMPLTKF